MPIERHVQGLELENGSGARIRAATVMFVLVLTFALLFTGALEPLEHRLTAVRAQLLDRAPSGQVAIVEIDAKSLAEISTWPWSRRYHAQVLQRLHSAGAAIVGFDVDFSSHSEPGGDRAFAETLDRVEPTILPIFQQRASDSQSAGTIRSRPAPMFGSAWVGGVNIFGEADGVVRDYPAATMIEGRIRPSLAVLLAENDHYGDRAFQPDWGIDARQIPRFSFVDVMKGRVPARVFAGKRVLVGATAIELGDRYTIPRFGTVPGVVIQALAADSLVQNRAVTRSGTLPTAFGLALIALLLGGPGFRRFNRTFPAAALSTLALLIAAPIAIQARWPLSLDSAAMLVCAVGCVAVRTGLEIHRRVRRGMLVDRESGLANDQALEVALGAVGNSEVVLAAASIDRFESIRNAVDASILAEIVRETANRLEGTVGQPVFRISPDTLAWMEPADDAEHSRSSDISDLFREPIRTAEGPIDIHLTMGMERSSVGSSARSKIERALAAIGSARAAGASSSWYERAGPEVRRQLSLMGELRRGMASGEVEVNYQPQLDLRCSKITHAEALVRWRHPVEGLIPPDRFIPLAEATGVIRELTEFVLSRVMADSASLSAHGLPMQLAVNVSAADIDRPDFVDLVLGLIKESHCDPSRLTLEVTESAIISSPATAAAALTSLRKLGLQLAVDDYGTGQSTLSYLKKLPVNELKIDKSFVTAICENPSDLIMVRSTVDLAHELGLSVVAEGVEDAATLDLLASVGCDYAQGYFVGKAMPVDLLSRLLETSEPERKVA